MPAPTANKNAFQHGLKPRRPLVLGTLPASCRGIVRDTATFRRALEAAVLEVRGELDVYAQAVVSTAAKWERHSALALRWLRTAWDELDNEQRLRFHEASCRAAENRDKCLKQLGLDTSQPARSDDASGFRARFMSEMRKDATVVEVVESAATASPASESPVTPASIAQGEPPAGNSTTITPQPPTTPHNACQDQQ